MKDQIDTLAASLDSVEDNTNEVNKDVSQRVVQLVPYMYNI